MIRLFNNFYLGDDDIHPYTNATQTILWHSIFLLFVCYVYYSLFANHVEKAVVLCVHYIYQLSLH